MTSTTQQIRKHLEGILNFMQPHWDFVNCHMVNYLTDSFWEKFIPEQIRNSIKTDHDINTAITEIFWESNSSTEFNQLSEFIQSVGKFNLDKLDKIVTSTEDLYEILKLIPNKDSISIKEFMSDKKRHEVEITAQLIADLSQNLTTNNKHDVYIVDAGDGKGYLSSRLALQYDMKVLGIDSNEVNTEGAQERNRKLQKAWNGLTERAELINQGLTPPRRGKKLQRKIDKIPDNNDQPTNYKTISKFITPNLDILEILKNEFQLYKTNENINVCLTGLHTCGNLASTSLKLFREQQSIQMICNVGCCYHLINEEFSNDDFFANKEIASKNVEFGFPMSQYLRQQTIKMGRNARMLAAQSIHRTVANREVSVKSLYYRAVLEMIILEKFPDLRNCIHVGKIKKHNNFQEYLQKCEEKLQIGLDELWYHGNYEQIYAKDEQFLKLFYLIRMNFAPVLETLILLDRLLYLKENNFENSFILQLFDPVVSPRCYGIISIRDS